MKAIKMKVIGKVFLMTLMINKNRKMILKEDTLIGKIMRVIIGQEQMRGIMEMMMIKEINKKKGNKNKNSRAVTSILILMIVIIAQQQMKGIMGKMMKKERKET